MSLIRWLLTFCLARVSNDVSRTLCAHNWQHRLRDPQRPEKVRFELGAHIIFRQFLDHAEVAIPGVIDNDIELAEVVSGSLYRVKGSAAVGDIELERQDSVAVPLDERVQGPQVASRCSNRAPRSRAASAHSRPKPFDAPVMITSAP